MIMMLSTALWLGILTSLSPCPLTSNIAAVSFVGRKIGKPSYILLTGLVYTLGRTVFYTLLGFILSLSMQNIPFISDWLQTKMVYIAGPLLIILGIIMLDIKQLNLPQFKLKQKTQEKLNKMGMFGSFFIGFLFASMLCPISAAFFFSNFLQSQGNLFVLAIFGIGTGLPVIFFAFILAYFAKKLSTIYSKTTSFEKYARLFTAIIFIVAGLYYIWRTF